MTLTQRVCDERDNNPADTGKNMKEKKLELEGGS